MSWLSVFLSGNFQYDAGVLGFLKVLEKFYPNQYKLAKGELRFSLKVLDDFNLSWFKMILLQNDIFNNSLYGKKKQNKQYRNEVEKVISEFAKLEDLEFEKRYKKLNFNIHQAIEKAKM